MPALLTFEFIVEPESPVNLLTMSSSLRLWWLASHILTLPSRPAEKICLHCVVTGPSPVLLSIHDSKTKLIKILFMIYLISKLT